MGDRPLAREVREERPAAGRGHDDHRGRGTLTGTEHPVLVETEGRVRILRLNRPDRLNAVSLPLYRELATALEDAASDRHVRVVVLTGAGRAFCAGADLEAHREHPMGPEERREYIATGQRVYRAIQILPQPVVAAVNGPAVGAGIELALSCDFIIVAAEARLRLPEVTLGTFIGGGTSYTLRRRVGYARAAELILLGEFFSGRDAVEWGLANEAAPAAEVLPRALELAGRLARNAPIPMRLAKRILDGAGRLTPEESMAAEADALEECMASEDWKEGVRAFAEGRDPVYRGE